MYRHITNNDKNNYLYDFKKMMEKFGYQFFLIECNRKGGWNNILNPWRPRSLFTIMG